MPLHRDITVVPSTRGAVPGLGVGGSLVSSDTVGGTSRRAGQRTLRQPTPPLHQGAAGPACLSHPAERSVKPRRPHLGQAIVRGLGLLVELADDAKLLAVDRLFAVTPKDREALQRAVRYVRALAAWQRDHRPFRLTATAATVSRSPR